MSVAEYRSTLAEFLRTHSEEALYSGSRLSQTFVEDGLGPEEIVALHFESLGAITAGMTYREQARAAGDSHYFLLEVMIAYGVRYKEYLELKLGERVHAAEARAVQGEERASGAEEVLMTVAHELNTPLTAAQANLDLAARMLSRDDPARAAALITEAREALERLTRLTGYLAVRRVGESSQLARRSVDVIAVLQRVISWVRPAAGAKGVSLELEARQAQLPVEANEDALFSIFGNLLSNAVRYTPRGGRVTLRCGEGPGWLRVEVEDTGIGMTDEVRQRIFERFYRAPEARSMEAQGLGLGLSLVQRLVRVHDGRIEVESRPGSGSTFRVLLPSQS